MSREPNPPFGLVYLQPVSAQRIARRICRAALLWQSFYPFHIDLKDVPPSSLNRVGTAFQMLIRKGIIEKTGQYRRSRRDSSSGRTVFEYTLANEAKALRFLKL